MKSSRIKIFGVILLSIATIGAALALLFRAYRSTWFVLKEINLSSTTEEFVFENEENNKLQKLDALKQIWVGKSLFDIKLEEGETLLEGLPSVKEVRLSKKLPSSIDIQFIERDWAAQFSEKSGSLVLVDTEGALSQRDLKYRLSDALPILQGEAFHTQTGRMMGLKAITELSHILNDQNMRIDTVSGISLLSIQIILSRHDFDKSKPALRYTVEVNLVEGDTLLLFQRLKSVINHLIEKEIFVSHLWLNDGKKIVVKTLTGS